MDGESIDLNYYQNYENDNLPLMVWKKEYDKDTDLLIADVVNPLMNRLAMMAFAGGNLQVCMNPLSNYERYKGDFSSLKTDYFKAFLYADYQSQDEEGLRDFNFYWYALNRITAEITKNDLRFSVNIINREAGEKRKKKIADIGAEAIVRNVISSVAETTTHQDQNIKGIDLAFAKEKSTYVPTNIEELYSMMNEKEASSAQIQILLHHVKEKYNLKRELLHKNLQDKGIINATFGIIEPNNQNDPVYRRVEPRDITWLGGTDIGQNGFDDCADAVQLTEFIPITTAFVKDAGLFDDNTTNYNDFKKYAEGKAKERHVMPHNGDMAKGAFWHYNTQQGLYVCRQKLYFKMVHYEEYEVLFDNRGITKEEFKDFKDYRKNQEHISLKKKDDNSTAKTITVKIPIVKLYEALRYADKYILQVREYPIQNRNSNDFIAVKFPITACVWQSKSIVTLGKDFAYLYHICMKKLLDEIKLLSVNDMLNFDVDALPDGYTANDIPLFIKNKLNLYSGSATALNSNSKESYKHLSTTKLSVSPSDISSLLNLAMMCANMFYRIIGLPPESNAIQNDELQSKEKNILSQGSMVLLPFYDEFIEDYSNQVLQKIADIGKYLWSKDKKKTVILGKGKTDTITLSPDIPFDEQGIFVENDYKSAKDKEFVMSAGMRALATGGVGFGELIKMYYADSPEHVKAIFDKGMTALEKLQKEDHELRQQMAALDADFKKMKLSVPLEVEKERTQRELLKQDMIENNKDEREAAKMDFKGQVVDIKHQQDIDILERKK